MSEEREREVPLKLEIPEPARKILRVLNEAGYEAYVVGGCVRDAMLGREPKDWDITTSAHPEQVKALFRRTLDTGLQHGTVTVRMNHQSYEVTTYRIDGEYEDSRHPKEVSFTPNLSEDLQRRDFTINAMAYHPEEGLVDLYGGRDDLAGGLIRAVGCPEERFQEDALRILRAIRFAGQLGFSLEEETYRAIAKFAGQLNRISRERIQAELTKLLCSPHPEKFRLAWETGITAVIFPDFDRMMELPQNNLFHCYSVGEHTLKMLTEIPAYPVLRWTALLHDVGKITTHTTDENGIDHFYGHGAASAKRAKTFLRELRFDNATIDTVTVLTRYHDYAFNMTKANLRRAIHKVGEDYFPLLLQVIRADTMAKSEYAKQQLLPRIGRVEELYREILEDGDCVSMRQLAVNGRDLIDAGMKPGPDLGRVLNQLLEAVLDDPSLNSRERLLALAGQLTGIVS